MVSPEFLGSSILTVGGGVAVPGGLDFHGGRDRLAIALSGLNGLAAESGFRRGLAVLVSLDGAGGAVSGLVLGDGTAVLLGFRLGDGAIVILGGFGLDRAAAGGIPVRGGTTAAAGRPIGNGQCSRNISDLIVVI